MPAWREPPRHSIYDVNTLNQKQRRASTKSTLLSCAAGSANLPAQQRSETALAWGCWPLAAEQAASQRNPVQPCVPSPGAARRRCSPSNRAQRRCWHCCCCCCCRCQLYRRAKSCHRRACPASDRLRRQLNNCRGCRRVAGGKKARAGCGEGLTRLPGGLRSRRARHAR